MCQAWALHHWTIPAPGKLSKRSSVSRGYNYNALNLGNLGHTKVSEGGGNSRKVAPFQSSQFRPLGEGQGIHVVTPGAVCSPRLENRCFMRSP